MSLLLKSRDIFFGAEQARKNPQFNWGSIKTYSTKKDLLC